MEPDPLHRAAVAAAVDVGSSAGFECTSPVVVGGSNNVVVWLAPHEVIAKVGISSHSSEVLGREVAVCAHLAASGAPSARPLGSLFHDQTTSLPVSLWKRLRADPGRRATEADLADALRQVHVAMEGSGIELPSCSTAVDRSRWVLFDDEQMAALAPEDLAILREAFVEWADRAAQWPATVRPLHGDPHLLNFVVNRRGPTLIDFEAACLGPLEWDLASMPPGVAGELDAVDSALLELLRLLTSARVATWCWAAATDPVMVAHGRHHLDVVRAARV